MRSVWQVAPADAPRAAALARSLGVDPLTAQVLLNRGLTTAQRAREFLEPTLATLEDARELPDLARAVARIRRAIEAEEPIFLFGDSDADGLTASVLLYELLTDLGARVRVGHANRIAEGYGLSANRVRRLCRSPIRLVLIVDCGTNQAEAVRELGAHGIDTIILDHHVPLAGAARPYALVNPHVDSGAGRELCSAGLAFKVAQAFGEGQPSQLEPFADLAAIGTLADCSPLLGENRPIVAAGLAQLARGARPGLARLCETTRADPTDPDQVIRRLVPPLNASGRLGDPSAVWELLRRDVADQLDRWLAAVESARETTQMLQRRVIGQAQEQVNRLHFRDQYVIVVSGAGWHQGIMGPLAAQLAERYGRPTIALALDHRQGVGSARSIARFDLLTTLQRCRELLVTFGGHAQACGLTLEVRHVEAFRQLVNAHAKEQLGGAGFVRTRSVDLELSLDRVARGWVEQVRRFAPFGAGNPKPTVAIRHVALEPKSSRTGWLVDGAGRLAVRGRLAAAEAGARYDVVGVPEVAADAVVLTGTELKLSAGPARRARTAGTSYTRAPG